MKKLLSLPPNLVGCFHDITGYSHDEWFCTNDPVGHKLGSGGGSTYLLRACYEAQGAGQSMDEWLAADRRLLLHASGQSRRLPSYAPSGKILTPIPVFRWERGQRLSQDLLSLQVPLYERIMEAAPSAIHTMIVSGDVYIRVTQPLQPIPDADVVCYGLWLGSEQAANHGVFVSSRQAPTVLKCMLQKPSVEQLGTLLKDHFYLTDVGIWLFSDKAVKVLMERSTDGDRIAHYDLYGEFGCALGTHPTLHDAMVSGLRVAILPLPGGEFYHFGTSRELLSSTLAIQNLVNDQRRIMHHSLKPHPAIFVQNSETRVKITAENRNLWIENSCVGVHWMLTHEHIITGVPENDFDIVLKPEQCVDVVPMGERKYVVRPYGFYDRFDGDLQQTPMFPVVESVDEMGRVLRYMLGQDATEETKALFERCPKMSAEQISAEANLRRLTAQRRDFRAANWPALARNYAHSVCYQTDLEDAAREFAAASLPEPAPLPADALLMTQVHDAMYDAILRQDFNSMGRLVGRTWQQNQQLDSGTNPAAIARLTALVDDLCIGYKLPGAGGGGYLYMVAKDPEAAARVKLLLNENRLNDNARFVEMSLSTTGLQVSRS